MDVQSAQNLLQQHKDKFDAYYKLLVEWNEKINLTAITQHDEVFVKHFEDSLYGTNIIPKNAKLCDVGSGAGFPGIPLAVVREDLCVTLVDSLNKRINFLQTVAEQLNLNISCIHTRAEDAGKGKLRESFDVVCARAVARLNTLCEYCLPLVKVGGLFLAYKSAADEEVQESKNAIKLLGGKIDEIKKFKLSNGDLRSIIVIKKIAATPSKYPRGKGKERSLPL